MVASTPSQVAKLKLQVKKLKEELSIVATDNESLQKEITSLSRKNTNLTRKVKTLSTKSDDESQAKSKPKAVKLSVVQTKAKTPVKPKEKQTKQSPQNESWVDKWWNSF